MSLPSEYASTVFRLEDPPSLLPTTFAIITAWNPMNERLPQEANETAGRALLADLEHSTATLFQATGASRDGSHKEPGWAADIPKTRAIALGRKYRQLAIWWIEGDDLILIDCATCDEQRLGSFRQRLG